MSRFNILDFKAGRMRFIRDLCNFQCMSSSIKQAFIIMQIGNPNLDIVCKEAIVPALRSCGLDPKRVDKHTEGRLLKSEIIGFIESADIIVADLTNERPNCYLEVGYAMGLDKFRNLILTAREDHNLDSPNYKKGGPKIHFDLSGYDILFWDPNNLNEFKEELEKRIRRRLATLPSYMPTPVSPWNEEWISKHQDIALTGLKKHGKVGFMEIRMTLPNLKLNIAQSELLRVADQAQIHTFGWPIGVVLRSTEYRPKPKTDGIVAEIDISEEVSRAPGRSSYDYWTIRRDGSFYLLKSLFEDMREPGQHIFFNTRIVRITEALLYAVRLYSGFKVPSDSRILIGIRHGGLGDRILSAVGRRHLHYGRKSTEDDVYTEVETTFEEIESDLVNLVQRFTQPLFVIFDFFEVGRDVLEDIVNNYVAGRVT